MKKLIAPIILVVVVLWLIGKCNAPHESKSESETEYRDINEEQKTEELPLDLRVDNTLKSWEDSKDFTSQVSDANSLWITWAVLTSSGKDLEREVEASNDKELTNKMNRIKEVRKKLQIANFPKLRKKYQEILKKVGWEENIEARIGGKSNEILTLTAGMFANNKAIKTMNETIYDNLEKLRFKQVRYEWYKGSEYQYWDLKTPKDSEIVD